MPELSLEPLTREAFAPFGELLDSTGIDGLPINRGSTRRYHALATLEIHGEDARAVLSIFEADPVRLPLQLTLMERHPLGSQAFQPLQDHPWLVVVTTDPRRPECYRTFFAAGRQGICYRPGVWHHPLLCLAHPGRFLVADRDGPGVNLEECCVADLALVLPALPE